ncbi:MAG: ATP-binding protein, partial [Candidatus Hodarchaeota archaeon]
MSLCACGKSGELKFPLTPRFLCSECYGKEFERKFLNNIPRKIRGHSIAVAFSGGKDSSSVLYILEKYRKKLKIPFIAAMIVDDENPEVQGARNKIVDLSKHKYPSVKFIQRSFSDFYNFSLPDLVYQSDKKKMGFTPCTICGILRRHAIITLSLELKVDYVIMGNTLNDEASTILLNILRGKHERNFRDVI